MMTVHCFDKFLQTARGLVLLIKEKRGFFFLSYHWEKIRVAVEQNYGFCHTTF